MVSGLQCSLYGLKQAPCAWFECFSFVVIDAGFKDSDHDRALFVHNSPHGWTLLLIYVYDMIIIGDDSPFIDFVKKRLSDKFLGDTFCPGEVLLRMSLFVLRDHLWPTDGTPLES